MWSVKRENVAPENYSPENYGCDGPPALGHRDGDGPVCIRLWRGEWVNKLILRFIHENQCFRSIDTNIFYHASPQTRRKLSALSDFIRILNQLATRGIEHFWRKFTKNVETKG